MDVQNFKSNLILSYTVGLVTFETFLRTEFSQENLEFWVACEDYKRNTPPEKLATKAREIFDMFVEVESPKEVQNQGRCKGGFRAIPLSDRGHKKLEHFWMVRIGDPK